MPVVCKSLIVRKVSGMKAVNGYSIFSVGLETVLHLFVVAMVTELCCVSSDIF